MRVQVLTLFPQMFPGPLELSITGKALQKGMWSLDAINIRDFAHDKHQTVDDTPYGGGAGMVLKADVVHHALSDAYSKYPEDNPLIIYLSPKGSPLKQDMVKSWSKNYSSCILLCGRYEGVDDRVVTHWKEKGRLIEVSIGDYVLTGGELAAMVIIDSWIRLLPNVVQKQESIENESFELDLLEFPHYTNPQDWQGKVVPEVLLSGDHKKIAAWRVQQAEQITKERRPDLWQAYLQKPAKPEIGLGCQGERNDKSKS